MQEEQNKPIGDLLNLKGKTAVVTGGAQGLGLAMSSRLSEAGATVVITDIDPETGEKAASELREQGRNVSFVECDVDESLRVRKCPASRRYHVGGHFSRRQRPIC